MLSIVAWTSLLLACACAVVIALDEIRRPQKMGIMNVVWPVTALYFSVFALWAYFRGGRAKPSEASDGGAQGMESMSGGGMHAHGKPMPQSPTLSQTALATSHCGAGCVLADIVTDFALFGLGVTVLGSELYASYLWDFVAAWSLGVVIQYFAIRSMQDLSVGQGIWAAMKADTLSIAAFQIGMYGWMALAYFKLFPAPHLHPDQAAYWLMMQVAMICGFVTAMPVNWLLVRAGWKEAM